MALTPFTVEGFGGLNLIDDPLEVGANGAVDMLNVWLPSGRVEPLPDSVSWGTATRTVTRVYTHGSGVQVLASESDGVNTTLEAFNLGGASVATTTYASASTDPHGFASIGTPTASRSYAVRGSDTTRRWDGAAWTAMGGMPTGTCAAPSCAGTRLAIGGANGNPHRVAFSTITGTPPTADPETFGANDYVDIAPGDGESICDLVSWQGQLFAFKNSKFAVFGVPSIDSSGNPVFNYRLVEGRGIGYPGLQYHGGACAAADGVYWVGLDGIYRTTGGPPELVSRGLTPLFPAQDPAPGATIPSLDLSTGFDITASNRWVFVSASGSSGKLTFVLQPDGKWLYWNIQANASSTARANFTPVRGTPVYSIAGSTTLRKLNPQDGPDNSVVASYKTGRYRLAKSGRGVVVPETSVVGTGSVTISVVSDHLYAAGAVATLGVSPATAEGWPSPPVDVDGTWFQTTLSATNTLFTVQQLRHWMSFVQPAGVL